MLEQFPWIIGSKSGLRWFSVMTIYDWFEEANLKASLLQIREEWAQNWLAAGLPKTRFSEVQKSKVRLPRTNVWRLKMYHRYKLIIRDI